MEDTIAPPSPYNSDCETDCETDDAQEVENLPECDKAVFAVYEISSQLDWIDWLNIIAFTWSPNPALFPSSDPSQQYKSLLSHILLCANKFFSHFVFVPEINTSGNIHIHGYYKIKDQIAYYKLFLPRCKQYGWVLLKDNKQTSTNVGLGWVDYLVKDIELTYSVLDEDLPIPLSQYNISRYKKLFRKSFQSKFAKRLVAMKREKIAKKTKITDYIK